jgi:hypothetical protein
VVRENHQSLRDGDRSVNKRGGNRCLLLISKLETMKQEYMGLYMAEELKPCDKSNWQDRHQKQTLVETRG